MTQKVIPVQTGIHHSLIVGLGNPEKKHIYSRHNIGFLAIDYLANTHKLLLSHEKFESLYINAFIFNKKILLVKPFTYMNLSGKAVLAFSHFYKILSQSIIVLHDDIDLLFGDIRIKSKGGDAGHNGVKSIIENLGTDLFFRVRMGIGRPKIPKEDVSQYVLSDFSEEQKNTLPQIFKEAQNQVEKILLI